MGVRKEYMDLAWEVARKLISLSDKDRENIFGYSDVSRIIKNFSILKVEFKIAKYEKELREEEIEDAESDEEKEKINLIIEVDETAYPPVGHIYLPSVDGYGWTWDILTYYK